MLESHLIAAILVVLSPFELDSYHRGHPWMTWFLIGFVKSDAPQAQHVIQPIAIHLELLASSQQEETSQYQSTPDELMFWLLQIHPLFQNP